MDSRSVITTQSFIAKDRRCIIAQSPLHSQVLEYFGQHLSLLYSLDEQDGEHIVFVDIKRLGT